MNDDGVAPRQREATPRVLARKESLSSDALRGRARRWAKENGKSYPLMRKRG